ncbi:DM13 domain-containing protein [Pseudonocardia sp. RS010]|uniref:DM13 domain-containing protein n=1 Tax=Pseudonocardia sp. RS010 TaxID=3385979 RepID=UPI0039A3EE5E
MAGQPGVRGRWRRRSVVVPAVVVLTLVVAAGLAWFEPWKLVVDESVAEPAPAAAAAPAGDGAAGSVAGPIVLGSGALVAHEHATTGEAQHLALPDGSRVLRLEDLVTSNGPRLRVWLTDAPVLPGREGWHVFDDGRYLDLGPLKGNLGSANYPVPAGADLAGLTSVSIWCERFSVSFGAATLAA